MADSWRAMRSHTPLVSLLSAGIIALAGLSGCASSPASQAGAPEPVTESWVSPFTDEFPSASPDGRIVLFQSNRNGRQAIYSAPASGGGAVPLIEGTDKPSHPNWSPDQRWIVFAADIEGQRDIFIIRPDGSDRRRLTDDPAPDYHPSFSRDGTRIFFNSSRAWGANSPEHINDHDIYSVRLDGTDVRRHTHCEISCTNPQQSPDGAHLAFRRSVPGAGMAWDHSPTAFNSEITISDLDGANMTSVTESPFFDVWPVWSQDGRDIYFGSNRESGIGHIYRVTLATREVVQITSSPDSDRQPTLSRDGRTLFFIRQQIMSGTIIGALAKLTLPDQR